MHGWGKTYSGSILSTEERNVMAFVVRLKLPKTAPWSLSYQTQACSGSSLCSRSAVSRNPMIKMISALPPSLKPGAGTCCAFGQHRPDRSRSNPQNSGFSKKHKNRDFPKSSGPETKVRVGPDTEKKFGPELLGPHLKKKFGPELFKNKSSGLNFFFQVGCSGL